QVAVAIAARSGRHRVAKAAPVPGPQIFRNDDVERLAYSVGGREGKNPLRTGIPECDAAFAVGCNDRVGGAVQQGFSKTGGNVHRASPLLVLKSISIKCPGDASVKIRSDGTRLTIAVP